MRKYLVLLFLLIPLWAYGATGDAETVIGKTDTAITTILGKAGTGIASVLGKNYTDGDGACSVAYGTEYATSNNATDMGGSETDATTGWTNSNANTFDSIDTAPDNGTYHLTVVSADASDGAYRSPSLTAGNLYRYRMRVRHNGTATNAGTWRVGVGSSMTGGANPVVALDLAKTDTTYQSYDKYVYHSINLDTLVLKENNTDNDGGVYVDTVYITAVTTPCLGAEKYSNGDAADAASEANATTGWTNVNADTFESTSDGTPSNGTYHIHASEPTGAGTAGARIYTDLSAFGMVDGTSYLVHMDLKHHGSDGDWTCGFNDDHGTTIDYTLAVLGNANTTYQTYGWEMVYSAAMRYFVCVEITTNNDGGVYIDNFSVKAISNK